MTLTEFLLARIADDEERASFVDSQLDDWARRQQYEPWRLSWQDEYDLLCVDPARAMADAHARRAAVLDLSTEDYQGGLVERTLKRLAAPYNSHPDFRDEWVLS